MFASFLTFINTVLFFIEISFRVVGKSLAKGIEYFAHVQLFLQIQAIDCIFLVPENKMHL